MNDEMQKRLEAWFDGELSPDEAREVEHLVNEEPEAKAYLDDLRRLRFVLQATHAPVKEATNHWQRVEERMLAGGEGSASRKISSFPQWLLATAAVLLLGIALWWPLGEPGLSQAANGLNEDSLVEMVETDLEGATPVVYLDQPSGWTVVWVVEESESSGI